jgi:hypothetical protein
VCDGQPRGDDRVPARALSNRIPWPAAGRRGVRHRFALRCGAQPVLPRIGPLMNAADTSAALPPANPGHWSHAAVLVVDD